MSSSFQVGQLVVPKGGGPVMTIDSVAEGKIQPAYNCIWSVEGQQYSGEFLADAIVLAEESKKTDKTNAQTSRLISSKEIRGEAVYGPGFENIGRIEHLLIDRVSGRVGYAIISFGGFLGLAQSHYPIPWSALKYDEDVKGYRTKITEAVLKEAPEASDGTLLDRDLEAGLHKHYNAPTYWGSTTAHQRSGPS